MLNKDEASSIIDPIKQLNLYGYKEYFNSFVKIINSGNIPNTILISGPKGIGKATFVYHLINYFFSIKEDEKYSLNNFSISENNSSFKLINQNVHPNFFLLNGKDSESEIKVDQVRNLIAFLSKSTYSKDMKIILIDNAETLNLNSSNALLKALEEPAKKTFFFVIHNSSTKLLETIKSRCIEYKITFTHEEKKDIFKKLVNFYNLKLENYIVDEDINFNSPGNIINYLMILNQTNNISILKNKLSVVLYFLEKIKKDKSTKNFNYFSLFIEIFYANLFIKKNNPSIAFNNFTKIINLLNNMKKYNLDEKNILIWIEEVIKKDAR